MLSWRWYIVGFWGDFMKKNRLFAVILIAVFLMVLLPVGMYFGIAVTNNHIANRVEKQLKNHPLPDDTVFFDSVAIAGKLVGNGNGMQYMGAILVSSDLSEEELFEYYSKSFEYVEIRKQESPKLDFLNTPSYSFELFGDPEHHDHYSITSWGSPEDVGMDWMRGLLNMDLRGH
jgi:hypothetical protein